MAIQQNFPSSRPSLSLNFARSKKLDPRITFTRTSSATYVGEDGLIKIAPANEARFDHDPVTGDSLGLLVEEARTNLVTYSEDFSDSSWTKTGSSISSNLILSPSGTQSADLIIEDTSTGGHQFSKNSTITNGVPITLSIYAKQKERSKLKLAYSTSNFSNLATEGFFDLANGTIIVQRNLNSASIKNVGNDWYLCSITATPSITTSSASFIAILNDSGIPFYTGDGTSGIYLWGAQLEQGSFPTSYIPTTASTVTRTADNASITGTNFSSWYRQDQGSILWIGNVYTREIQAVCPYKITEGSSLRGIGVQFDTRSESYNTFFASRATSSNIPSKTAPAGTIPSGTKIKIAGAYEQGVGISAAFNGTGPAIEAGTTQTDIVFGTENQIDIGGSRCISGSNNKFTGICEQLCYYPVRLPNQILQNLTK
jgi:hypothetical protein